MTAPNQPHVSEQQFQGRGATKLVIVALVLVALLTMAFGVLCIGLSVLYIARPKVNSAIERASASIRGVVTEPEPDWNDWMVKREMTHLYQTSLESVVLDKAVSERLGNPVMASLASDDLFRREAKGEFDPNGERITFDVEGPKGVGKVAVLATPRGDGHQPDTITVTFPDGSRTTVTPLHRPLPPVR